MGKSVLQTPRWRTLFQSGLRVSDMKKANIKIIQVNVDSMATLPTELAAQARALALLNEMNINCDDIPPTRPGVVWTKPGPKTCAVEK